MLRELQIICRSSTRRASVRRGHQRPDCGRPCTGGIMFCEFICFHECTEIKSASLDVLTGPLTRVSHSPTSANDTLSRDPFYTKDTETIQSGGRVLERFGTWSCHLVSVGTGSRIPCRYQVTQNSAQLALRVHRSQQQTETVVSPQLVEPAGVKPADTEGQL